MNYIILLYMRNKATCTSFAVHDILCKHPHKNLCETTLYIQSTQSCLILVVLAFCKCNRQESFPLLSLTVARRSLTGKMVMKPCLKQLSRCTLTAFSAKAKFPGCL